MIPNNREEIKEKLRQLLYSKYRWSSPDIDLFRASLLEETAQSVEELLAAFPTPTNESTSPKAKEIALDVAIKIVGATGSGAKELTEDAETIYQWLIKE